MTSGWAGAETALRVVLGGVVFAAGLSGVLLLAAPGSTPRTFAWGLQPQPLAALVGGFYLASAATFAYALRQRWPATRGLGFGVLALTIPTFAATLVHLDTFDLSRVLALLWILLFAVTPVLMAAILVTHPPGLGAEDRRLARWVRLLLGLFALVSVAYGTALWIDPLRFGGLFPFELPPLGGRFVGCWLFFLATLAAYATGRDRAGESRVSLVALASFALGALLGALRTFGDLEPSRVPYVAALALLALVALAGARRTF